MERKYGCVLFDLDNTVLDTDPVRLAALEACDADVGKVTRHDLRNESPLRLIGRRFSLSDYWAAYIRNASLAILPDGMETVLSQMRQKEILTGIVTSSPGRVAKDILKRKGLAEYFIEIVGYRRGQHNKPSGDPILAALGALGRGKEDALYVGDNVRDFQASANAGVDFGLALWGALEEDERLLAECHLRLDTAEALLKVI